MSHQCTQSYHMRCLGVKGTQRPIYEKKKNGKLLCTQPQEKKKKNQSNGWCEKTNYGKALINIADLLHFCICGTANSYTLTHTPWFIVLTTLKCKMTRRSERVHVAQRNWWNFHCTMKMFQRHSWIVDWLNLDKKMSDIIFRFIYIMRLVHCTVQLYSVGEVLE